MKFCDKCGSLLKAEDEKLKCLSCGYETSDEEVVTFKKKKNKDIEIAEEDVETYPVIKSECPHCGNDEAYHWTVQTRSADEPETIFFKCTLCKHKWRQY